MTEHLAFGSRSDSDVMAEALRYMSEQFSVSREEWRQHHKGGDMLLDGLVSNGYVLHQDGRFAVSESGRRMLEDWRQRARDE